MKGQSQITSHTRRNIYRPKVEITKKNADAVKASFRPAEEIIKPKKIQKPVIEKPTRKSARLTENKKTQTTLYELYADKKKQLKNTKNSNKTADSSENEINSKRKLETDKTTINANKKQKTKKIEKKMVEEVAIIQNEDEKEAVIEDKISSDETKTDDIAKVSELENASQVAQVVPEEVAEKAKEEETKEEETKEETKDEVNKTIQDNIKETEEKEEYETHLFEQQIEFKSSLSLSTESSCSLVEDDSFTLDTPSPTFHSEPMTPPQHHDHLSVSAPYKTILSPADKARISDEKSLLMKLRKALDVVITDRVAHNQPVLYHKIESVLRNSTRRTIVIGHLCQIMSVAPDLYGLFAREIRDFGGKATEAYLIEFGKDWVAPLVGKDLQKRSDILEHGIDHYFETHKEPYATIPKKELPKLKQVIDKKDWINDAKLPPGVKSLITAHEKIKALEAEKAKPKPKPQGSVKDRLAALKARLKEKKA